MNDADGDRTPPVPATDWALFLDVDGTLTRHADRPDAVVLDDGVRPTLQRLDSMLDGALALVTGRSLPALDALLEPLRMPHAACLHGLQYRRAGTAEASDAPCVPRHLAEEAQALAGRHPGALVEVHGPCLYLHWRAAPAASAAMTRLAERIGAELATHRLHRGAHGIEIRPRGMDKGGAIRRFMALPPFAGRTPVFAGDDPADEPGFAAVNEMGGISVRVGPPRPSAARFALADAGEVLAWLALHEAHATN